MKAATKASRMVEAETTIRKWTAEASKTTSKSPPDLSRLCEALKGGAFKDASPSSQYDRAGRQLIEVTVKDPRTSDGSKSRFFLPAHAAIARVLELGGARVKLHAQGTDKSLYHFMLRFPSKPLIETSLARILLDMPSNYDLLEKKEGRDHHRFVLPETFHVRVGPNRAAFLDRVQSNVESATLGKLLLQLFRLADKWHGAEFEPMPIVWMGSKVTR